MNPSWTRLFEHPFWRLIAADMGASPEVLLEDSQLLLDFLQECVRCHDTISDLSVALPDLGLSVGQAVDLIHPAILAERAARIRHDEAREVGCGRLHDGDRLEPLSQEARTVVKALWIRGLDPERIDRLLFDYLARPVAAPFLDRHPVHRRARAVFKAHRAGLTVYRMERELRIDGTTATDILGLLGEKPNVSPERQRARSNATTIVKLYESGLTYQQIVDRLLPHDPDINLNKVRHALQRARKKGRISGYRPQARRHHNG